MENELTPKTHAKIIGFGLIGIFFVVTFFSTFTIIQPQERGLQITMGKITADLEPGFYITVPFIQNVEHYNMTTRKLDVDIAVTEKGAITKDNQTIGSSMTVFYKIRPDAIRDIKTRYSIPRIEDIVTKTTEQKFKEVVGQNTIFDIAVNQNKITNDVNKAIIASVEGMPFVVENVQITNYDWSDEFDANIKETMNRAQQVKQKEQELLITEKESQKIVKKAEAERQAAILDAEAKAAAGEGIRKYNEEIAKTIDIEKQFRALEIEKIKAEKWNGQYVPSQVFTPIPLDLRGSIQK